MSALRKSLPQQVSPIAANLRQEIQRRGGSHRGVEHRQVAGPPQRRETQALNAPGLVGDDGRVVGVRMGRLRARSVPEWS
jgi:hypothetical protein